MQLTQEYFDKGLSNLLEKVNDRINGLETKIVTKEDLKSQTAELKRYTTEAFETQQLWMKQRFDELIVNYDVRERVGRLEKDVAQLKLNRPARA